MTKEQAEARRLEIEAKFRRMQIDQYLKNMLYHMAEAERYRHDLVRLMKEDDEASVKL